MRTRSRSAARMASRARSRFFAKSSRRRWHSSDALRSPRSIGPCFGEPVVCCPLSDLPALGQRATENGQLFNKSTPHAVDVIRICRLVPRLPDDRGDLPAVIAAVEDHVHEDVVGAAAPLLAFRIDVFDDIFLLEFLRPFAAKAIDLLGDLIER